MTKDFVSVQDLTRQDIAELFALTDKVKSGPGSFTDTLRGKTLALMFQKPSNRTRVSFEVGMYQLGGYSIYLGPGEINLGVRESVKDVAKTLSKYVNGIVLRTFEHKNLLELAAFATVPVINGLSDLLHPCQALADVYTIKEKLKGRKIKVAFVGDGNNVLHSLMHCLSKVGIDLAIATPARYEPKAQILKEAQANAEASGSRITLGRDPEDAAREADVIYTDVWTSMGQEREYKKRLRAFRGFQVNEKLIGLAKKGALVMHCLPAHRGQEIADAVIDSARSIVFDLAENRMHTQKAILIKLLGNNSRGKNE
ncbi:MAG: ornithine carbamoyltransferase [Candidatus Omnitrophica bacterium]|nr:ornithine carbamoyltransferase [Candidatus Omnitrophota bacterium]